MMLPQGTRLGSYEIIALLGAGGMGEVYRARDHRLQRFVAIKLLTGDDDPLALRHEARATAALNHPNICTIHEIGDAGGTSFIVMELVEGTRLNECPADVAAARVQHYAAQIADALMHAHERGIVHRDLKGANVIVTPGDRIKVLDFGIARRVDPAGPTETTARPLDRTGVVAGTPAYIAPEVLRGGAATPRSDIWALGVVMFEMCAGCRPFDGPTAADLSSAILRDAPAALPPATSPGIGAVILKCLAKDPDQRYQTAADLKAAIDTASRLPGVHEPATASIRSMAVLPLTNLSRDPEQEFFADGMTDALIAELVQTGATRVIARNSSMRFKGSAESISAIARALGVDAIVQGTVIRSGASIRVTAELVLGSTDSVAWARSYDRPIADVLALQADIARAIAEEIRGVAGLASGSPRRSKAAVNPDAYLEYLKGRFYWRRLTMDAVRKALEHFQASLEIDPAYAHAHAGIATCHGGLAWTGAAPPKLAFTRSKAAAKQALALDDTIAEAHTNLGYIAMNDWDWDTAERHHRHAVALDPGSADALLFLCFHHTAMARHDEAIACLQRAQELDPLSPLLSNNLAYQSYFARRFEFARRHCAATLEIDPTFEMTHWVSGILHTAEGDYVAAVAELERAANASAGVVVLGWLGYAYALAGRAEAAVRVLERLLATGPEWTARLPEIARVQVGLGRHDAALTTIEEAVAIRAMGLQYLKVDASMDPIRDDPRYVAALKRIGL